MSGDFNSIDPLLVGLTFVIVGVNAGNLCKADFPKDRYLLVKYEIEDLEFLNVHHF